MHCLVVGVGTVGVTALRPLCFDQVGLRVGIKLGPWNPLFPHVSPTPGPWLQIPKIPQFASCICIWV